MIPTMPDLESIVLKRGGHSSREDGMCAMEAAAWIAGQPHSSAPPCVCPVLRAFTIRFNDRLDHVNRQRLKAFIPRLLNTSGDGKKVDRRFIALDWFLREGFPMWLEPVPELREYSEILRNLPPITSPEDLALAQPSFAKAKEAAITARSDLYKRLPPKAFAAFDAFDAFAAFDAFDAFDAVAAVAAVAAFAAFAAFDAFAAKPDASVEELKQKIREKLAEPTQRSIDSGFQLLDRMIVGEPVNGRRAA